MPKNSKNAHTCHAKGCDRAIAAKFLMCGRHWAMVPPKLQIAVYREYRPGQEIEKNPTHEYLVAMWRAIFAVAQKEGKPLSIFEEDRQRAIAHFGIEPPALAQVIQEMEGTMIKNPGFSSSDDARMRFAASSKKQVSQSRIPRIEIHSEDGFEVIPLVQVDLPKSDRRDSASEN
jgi:hypothetical protein